MQVTVTGSQKSQESVNLDVPLPRCHLCGCLTTVSPTAQPLPPSPVGVTLAGPPLKATKLLADAKMLRWQSLAGEPKSYNFSMLLAWHSRGQEFNSLQLHQIGNQNPRSLKNGRGFLAYINMSPQLGSTPKTGASPLDGQIFRLVSDQFPCHFSSTKRAHAGVR